MKAVTNDKARSRYAIETSHGTAIADYVINGDTITFTHTHVPTALEGQGIASRLIQFALSDARDKQLKVVPQCSFVDVYIERHPEWRDLLA